MMASIKAYLSDSVSDIIKRENDQNSSDEERNFEKLAKIIDKFDKLIQENRDDFYIEVLGYKLKPEEKEEYDKLIAIEFENRTDLEQNRISLLRDKEREYKTFINQQNFSLFALVNEYEKSDDNGKKNIINNLKKLLTIKKECFYKVIQEEVLNVPIIFKALWHTVKSLQSLFRCADGNPCNYNDLGRVEITNPVRNNIRNNVIYIIENMLPLCFNHYNRYDASFVYDQVKQYNLMTLMLSTRRLRECEYKMGIFETKFKAIEEWTLNLFKQAIFITEFLENEKEYIEENF